MDQNNTINVASVVAPVISSRDVISVLKSEVTKLAAQHVKLDFAQVEFISRSAAHEILRLKEQFSNQDHKKTVEFINTSEEVSQMLRTVASNRAVPKAKNNIDSIKTVSISDLDKPSSPLQLLSSPLQFLKKLFAN